MLTALTIASDGDATMTKAVARVAVLSVGGMIQAQVHGVTLALTSTEAWDLGALLCDAAAQADGESPIDWEATRRAVDAGCDALMLKPRGR